METKLAIIIAKLVELERKIDIIGQMIYDDIHGEEILEQEEEKKEEKKEKKGKGFEAKIDGE